MKISIIGYSGSGKSTLADSLAEKYKIPALFLDTVFFKPQWIERDKAKVIILKNQKELDIYMNTLEEK